MKKIGMIGGLTWESTAKYYDIINKTIQTKLGSIASAEILLYSFNFAEVEALQSAGKWDTLTDIMVHWADTLKTAGASFIVICANTMHKMAPDIEAKSGLPVLHIADVTGKAIVTQGLNKVALLGTKYVMESDFYVDILQNKFGIDVLIPTADEREIVHNVIFNELIKGVISDASRKKYLDIIDRLVQAGAQGIVLGCTELPILIQQSHVSVPVFDTTAIHAKAAVTFALENEAQTT